jgi:hypothetical protein
MKQFEHKAGPLTRHRILPLENSLRARLTGASSDVETDAELHVGTISHGSTVRMRRSCSRTNGRLRGSTKAAADARRDADPSGCTHVAVPPSAARHTGLTGAPSGGNRHVGSGAQEIT